MPNPRKAAVLTIAAVAALTVAAPAASARPDHKEPEVASVTGWGEIRRTYHQDEDVRAFTFEAEAAPYTRPVGGLPGAPNDATGTVRISHYSAEDKKTYTAEGHVDSMVTAPGYATLTAVIDEVSKGGPMEWVGKRLGFSVYDGGKDKHGRSRDRVGYSWEFTNMVKNANGKWVPNSARIGTSMAPAPFAPVTEGGFTVVHKDLPPVPKN